MPNHDGAQGDRASRIPAVFSTSRMRATRIQAADLDDLIRPHLDPDVSRFLGGVRSPEQTAAYVEVQLRHWREHGFGLWILRSEQGGFLGRAGLRYVELEGKRALEIAYTFAKAAWGRGLASEVATALVDLWLATIAEPVLVGIVEKGNSASERVLLKAGFTYDRDAWFHDAGVGVFHRLRVLR
ncbi:GNAT family N-acetyltransferase [Reyranella sp.]|uniref:GNAT family N-acetyltransferase n=1 Tax=Reyranella sp. TaxID=1929291 RepID=UPI003BAD77F4